MQKKKEKKRRKEKEHLGLLFIFDLDFEQSNIKKFQVEVESAAECIDCGLTTSGLRALTGETTARPSLSFCAGNYPADFVDFISGVVPAKLEHGGQVEYSRRRPQGCGEFAQFKSSPIFSAGPF